MNTFLTFSKTFLTLFSCCFIPYDTQEHYSANLSDSLSSFTFSFYMHISIFVHFSANSVAKDCHKF